MPHPTIWARKDSMARRQTSRWRLPGLHGSDVCHMFGLIFVLTLLFLCVISDCCRGILSTRALVRVNSPNIAFAGFALLSLLPPGYNKASIGVATVFMSAILTSAYFASSNCMANEVHTAVSLTPPVAFTLFHQYHSCVLVYNLPRTTIPL